MTMTYEDFLGELQLCVQDGAQYRPSLDDEVRLYYNAKYCCPITVVCLRKTGKYYRVGDARKAAKRMRLDESVAQQVMDDADLFHGETLGYTELVRICKGEPA